MDERVNVMSETTKEETSGLYVCPNCRWYYTFGAEAIALIKECLSNESGISRGLARCQCGESLIFGGKKDGESILIFGEDSRNKNKYEDLRIIDNLMLMETSEDDPDVIMTDSTYDGIPGKTIYLKLIQ